MLGQDLSKYQSLSIQRVCNLVIEIYFISVYTIIFWDKSTCGTRVLYLEIHLYMQ